MKAILFFCVIFFLLDVEAKTFAIVGDAGYWNTKAKEVRDSIVRAGVNG